MSHNAYSEQDTDVEFGTNSKISSSGGSKAIGLRATIFVMAGFMIVLSPLLFLCMIAADLAGSDSGQGTPDMMQPLTYSSIAFGVIAGILACIGGDRAGPKSAIGWTVTSWVGYLANFIVFGLLVTLNDRISPIVFLLCAILIAQLVSGTCFVFLNTVRNLRPLHGSC